VASSGSRRRIFCRKWNQFRLKYPQRYCSLCWVKYPIYCAGTTLVLSWLCFESKVVVAVRVEVVVSHLKWRSCNGCWIAIFKSYPFQRQKKSAKVSCTLLAILILFLHFWFYLSFLEKKEKRKHHKEGLDFLAFEMSQDGWYSHSPFLLVLLFVWSQEGSFPIASGTFKPLGTFS